MTRRLLPALLAGVVLLAGLAGGDEPPPDKGDPPLRLKRKKRDPDAPAAKQPGKADQEKPKVPGKDKDKEKAKDKDDEPLVPEDGRPGPGADEEDEKEVLERIERNMRAVEEKLGNRELGEPTAQQQRDILKDIDSLIKRSEQQSGGGGGQQQQQQEQQGEQDKQGQQDKQGGTRQQRQQGGGRQMARRGGRRQPRQLRSERGGKQREGGRMMAGGPRPGDAPQPKQGAGGRVPGGMPANPPGGSVREVNTENYKDVWGHLPESLRAEMNAYSNPQPFLPRYDRLIREYYKTIAEQGRKKGD